jgi:rhodanese-related sulfurtransferase
MIERFNQFCLVLILANLLASNGCTRTPPPEPSTAEAKASAELEKVKTKTRSDYPDVSHITTQQVQDWLADTQEKTIVFDVREPGEFAVSHLDGAINLSPSASATQFKTAQLKDVPKDRRIVLYCSVGIRSSKMAQRLKEAGYTNVHNMAGSIFQWANDGRTLQDANGPAKTVHPYNMRWGQLLKPKYRDNTED